MRKKNNTTGTASISESTVRNKPMPFFSKDLFSSTMLSTDDHFNDNDYDYQHL